MQLRSKTRLKRNLLARSIVAVSLIGLTVSQVEPLDASLDSPSVETVHLDHSHDEHFEFMDYKLPPDDEGPYAGTRSLVNVPLLGPSGDSIRTLRMALATTGGYSAKFFGDATTEEEKRQNVSDELDRAVARLNEIFTAELGVRFELVPNNDELIFLDATTDEYRDNSNSADNDTNQIVIDRIIGTANYDIGHVFTAAGGGNAILGGVGDSRYKAIGASGSSGSGTGDGFWMTVAHEIGHMFGARHTYALNTSVCESNVNDLTSAVEPGSGTTIMSYAGFCGSSNIVQSDNDPYFHAVSIAQMRAYMAGPRFGNAGTVTSNSNSIPNVAISPPVSSLMIPPLTPFALTANGSDPDAGDQLTYAWEQTDTVSSLSELIGLAVEPKPAPVPLFRSRLSSSSTRNFPAMSTLLGNKTNQDAPCSALGTNADRVLCNSEHLPSTARTMDFRVTVRDGRGGVTSANVDVVVTGSTPFSVTSQNSHEAYPIDSIQNITWDTAGTESWTPAFSTVDIFTSIDGGQTWSLAIGATPNDGTEALRMPNISTSQFRVKVQPQGAIFFDVSNTNVSLYATGLNGEPDAPTVVTATRGNSQVSVSWVEPVSSGSSSISQYLVTSTPGGRTCTTATTTCSVTGLTNGTPYTFTVRAYNQTVSGPLSVASQTVTPATRPDPPTGVSAVAGDGRATVSWVAPAFDGGAPITEYSAWSNPGNRWCVASQTLSCTITGLTNGTAYTFSVYAANDVNPSYESDDSASVTPVAATTTTTSTTTLAPTTSAPIPTTSATVPPVTATPSPVEPSQSDTIRLTMTEVRQLTPGQFSSLTPSVISLISPSIIPTVTTRQISALKKSQVKALTRSQVSKLTTRQIAVLKKSQLSALQRSQVSAIKTKTFKKLSVRQLKAIKSSSVSGLSLAQIRTLNRVEANALRLNKLIKRFSPARQRAIRAALRR